MDVVTKEEGTSQITLVLGGTRSGKSEVAERLVVDQVGPETPITYVATGATARSGDAGWSARIEAHRRRRPVAWSTLEIEGGADLGEGIRRLAGPVLVDSLGGWLARVPDFDFDAELLGADLLARRLAGFGPTVIVSEEVGLGVHPPTEVGNAFADALGSLNRRVADEADRVLLVVAGRVLELDRLGES